ncbi:hypothetical protein N9B82_03970 [Saprospiraceae bacterium]|nr:hypothetical protein [Saprospiraceae bacterium]
MIRITEIITCLGLIGFLVFTTQSCERLGTSEENPFDENKINQDTVNFTIEDVDPNSIAGLYQNIFRPTCANVGCHDGNFEPDFRSIESSYYTMVNKVPIKNDGSLTYRVDPGNPATSAIISRLNGDITPPMPIEVEPDGDWLEKEDEYIQNVRNWIENGALDLAGNSPELNIVLPSLMGASAFYNGLVLKRENGYGSIIVPDSVSVVQFYLAFDPLNQPEMFTENELSFGFEDDDGFQEISNIIMDVLDVPVNDYGLYGTLIDYTHSIQLDLNALSLNEEKYFMRIRVQDGTNPITEIPANNGLYYIKEYMSFHRAN